MVPDERIQSTVSNGWVTLEGTVTFPHEREYAERAIRHLAGVQGVTDRIVVLAPPVEPEDVQQGIEEALARRAEREARRIRVTVEEGKVTLVGAVHSWAERRAVVGAARATPGVHEIADQLRIEPFS